MSNCRENYSLKILWKYNKFYYFIKKLFRILSHKSDRKNFFIDNFKLPYSKYIKCKIFKYEIHYSEYLDIYCCKNCYKIFNIQEYKSYIRKEKIKKLSK